MPCYFVDGVNQEIDKDVFDMMSDLEHFKSSRVNGNPRWNTDGTNNKNPLLGCPRKLGSMVSKRVITYLKMEYIGGITHILTFYYLPATSK